VHKALYGTPAKPGFQVLEQRVAKVKEQIYKPEYKAFKEQIAKIRGNPPANTTSSEGMQEMVVSRFQGAVRGQVSYLLSYEELEF
jgi:hypothetical protein